MEDQLQEFLMWLSERYDLQDGTYYHEDGRHVNIHNIVWEYLEVTS